MIGRHAGRRRPLMVALIGLLILGAVAGAFVVGKRAGGTHLPTFQRLTFRRGSIYSARFAPEGHTIVYTAGWDGKAAEIFTTRPGSPESRPLGITAADILSISPSGEMALLFKRDRTLNFARYAGTLARAPLAGGAPREILEGVKFADWGPSGPEDSLAVVRSVNGKDRGEFPIGKVLYETADDIGAMRISPRGDLIGIAEHSPVFGMDGRIAVLDRGGKKKVLTGGFVSDYVDLAWSGPDEIWFDTRSGGDDTLYAVSLDGRLRLLARLPDPLQLFDISSDGRVLLARSTLRVGINGLPAGETKERDLSLLDVSEIDDVSPDGKTLLITKYGKGGGAGHWSVYLRKTDGSPAVRLGEGQAFSLSPDGKQAVTMLLSPPQLVFLPIGPGEPTKLKNENIRAYQAVLWQPDGKRIFFLGDEAGQGLRGYVQDLAGGAPRPVTPPGLPRDAVAILSPDSKSVAIQDGTGISVYPMDGGQPRPIPGLNSDYSPAAWVADGLYIYWARTLPFQVYRVDPSTGQKQLWKEIEPADPAGVRNVYSLQLSRDLKSYFYSYSRDLVDLYLVEGLK